MSASGRGQATKYVYLLRHAKSSWEDPGLDDHERPLAPRGRKAATRVGRYLEDARIRPALVLCSSARRTQETLERLAPRLPGTTRIEIEPGLYGASARTLLARLQQLPESVDSVLVVGHNPGVQELALLLAARGERLADVRATFPTGALATLALDGAWSDLRPGGAELVAFVAPRELR